MQHVTDNSKTYGNVSAEPDEIPILIRGEKCRNLKFY